MPTEFDSSGVVVLIVDDEDVIIDITSRMLKRSGFEVHIAETGEGALAAMKEHRPAVVLTDKNLPGMTGLEVVQSGKELLPHAEFIVMTGYASLDSSLEAMKLGVFAYITKPFSRGEVTERVTAAAQTAQKNREMQRVFDNAGENARPGVRTPSSRVSLVELAAITNELASVAASLSSVVGDAPEPLRDQGKAHLAALGGLLDRLTEIVDSPDDE